MNIDYNKNFLYNYNIFNKNNIGIGILTPQHTLDINGNLNINNDLNVEQNIYLKKFNINLNNIIYYNPLTKQIKPIEFINSENNSYNWIHTNNSLDFDYFNNIDNICHFYESEEYLLNINQDTSINIYLQNIIIISHIFLYKKINNIISPSYIQTNWFTINGINSFKINDYYYKLNQNIILNNINNLNNILYNLTNNIDTNIFIKFIGKYKFNNGNMWDSLNNNNIFINKNVNISNNFNNNYQLNVNGSTIINYSLNINKSINSKICNITNNLNNKNILLINSLIKSNSNKLNINLKKKNLSIGTLKNNHFCNIGDNTYIDFEGNVNTNNYNINYDLNLNNKNSNIKFKNNNIITFSESLTRFNNLYIYKDKSTNSVHDDIYLLIKNNLNINIKDKEYLYINGNFKITGNIDIKNNLNIKETLPRNNIFIKNINNNTIIYSNNINNTNLFIANNINSNIINLNLLKLGNYKNNTPGLIYYNTNLNQFCGISNTKHVIFNINNNLNIFDSITRNINTNINVDIANIKEIKIKNNLNLPYKNNLNSENFNIKNLGQIYFNLNSLKAQIFNGYKYGSIEYENNLAEIPNIYLGNLNAIRPKFNSRIINYNYSDTVSYLNIITNPKTNISVDFFNYNNNIYQLLFQNNNLFNTMIDININKHINRNTQSFNKIIIQNNNNINLQQLKYTIFIN